MRAASLGVWQSISQKRAETVVVKETSSPVKVNCVVPVMSSHCAGAEPPVMEQRRRRVGGSWPGCPLYCVSIPLFDDCGNGMHSVIGLWNFRRRGSTVTMGDTATRFPCKRVTISCGTGCACTDTLIVFVREPSGKMACTRGTTDERITPPSGPTQ